MPSPFPGMDPYLEEIRRWPDVHHELISVSREILNSQLRPKYVARLEERIYLSEDDEADRTSVIPDVRILMRGQWQSIPFEPKVGATAQIAEPIRVITTFDVAIHEARIEILDQEGRSVVTAIEFLSPSNKVSSSPGGKSFEAKRKEIMDTAIHWVEIDLLRAGRRIRFRRRFPDCEYLAYVSHAERRPQGLIWPIRLSQRLPVISIPLKPEDADATLDLQDVLNTAYDRAGYDLDVNYTREPVPPLPPEWAEWSDKLLKFKGLRPS